MSKVLRFLAEDKILRLLLLGVLGPLFLVILDVLIGFLGIEFSITGGIFNYAIYVFIASFVSFIIYIPFFKKTANTKTKETKILIFFWLLISVVVLIVWAQIASFQLSLESFETIMFSLLPASFVLFVVGVPFLLLNIILGKGSNQKRQILIFSVSSVVVASLITATLVYFLKPSRTAIQIYPWDLKDGKQFSCSTKMGTTLFPRSNYKKHIMEIIDGDLFTNDKTKMAIEIDGKILKMLTATSVEIGIAEPTKLAIVRENENELIAVDPESDVMIGRGVGTFILNKKSGTAVWTKSKPSFIGTSLPNVQAYYMECR